MSSVHDRGHSRLLRRRYLTLSMKWVGWPGARRLERADEHTTRASEKNKTPVARYVCRDVT
jgi:hypothetical protein